MKTKKGDRHDDGPWVDRAVVIDWLVAYALGWRPQLNQNGSAQIGQTPLEILKARYARGEISREEYDQMHQDLEG